MPDTNYKRCDTFSVDPTLFPDIKVVGGDGAAREAHRAILSRLSTVLSTLLKLTEGEEDLALIIPDVPGSVLDLTLQLAYSGWLGGLGLNHISQVRDVCTILNMRQSDFVVRAEEKSISWLQQNSKQLPTESLPVLAAGDDMDRAAAGGDKQVKVQGSFQCCNCAKTFIYAKSYERHVQICLPPTATATSDHMDMLDACLEDDGGGGSHPEDTYNTDSLDECVRFAEAASFVEGDEADEAGDPDILAAGDELSSHRKKRRRCSRVVAKDKDDLDEGDDDGRSQLRELFKFVHYAEGPDGEFYCRYPGCQYADSFRSLTNCKNHQLAQHATQAEKVFACCHSGCSEHFASRRLRNKHVNQVHNMRFACGVCGRKFAERTRLRIHSRVHTGEKPFVCEQCGYSCSQRDNLKKHKEFKHPTLGQSSRRWVCEVCEASFHTKSNLTRHRAAAHSLVRLVQCETCGKEFKDSGALRQHMFSHGEAEFMCRECGASFTSPLYLYRHTLRKHPAEGVQPHRCGMCGKGFPLNHQLQEHMQSVHQSLKHCCPNCHQVIGRRTSVHRHLKKGRCPGLKIYDQSELPVAGLEQTILGEELTGRDAVSDPLLSQLVPVPPSAILTLTAQTVTQDL